MKKTEDKAMEARHAFDVTGPSLITPSLRRSEAAMRRTISNNAKCDLNPPVGWSIGKTDPNVLFMAENRRNFGTRKIRSKT